MERDGRAVGTAAEDATAREPNEGRTPISWVVECLAVVTGTAVTLGALFGSWGCAFAAGLGGWLMIATETRANWRKYGRIADSASAAGSAPYSDSDARFSAQNAKNPKCG